LKKGNHDLHLDVKRRLQALTALFNKLYVLYRERGPKLWTELKGLSLSFFRGLSGRLLLITFLFVLALEVFILIPSLAGRQESWLTERVRRAEIASQALEAAPQKTVTQDVAQTLLRSVAAKYLSIKGANKPDIILRSFDEMNADVIDLRLSHSSLRYELVYLWGPWATILAGPQRQIRIDAKPNYSKGEVVSIVVEAEPLRQELISYLISILRTTLTISVALGLLLFILLSVFIVRPIRRMTRAITRFRDDPEDGQVMARLSGRRDEIGQIEFELSKMQEEVRQSLRSRNRLAALGQAVAKINHDLRNMLTAAQMASDRLATSGDPTVTKALPRLERALDRALSLTQNVLNYGKSDEVPAHTQSVKLKDIALAAAEDAGLGLSTKSPERVRFTLKADNGFSLDADPEHLHRMLVNLMRNARQAMEFQPHSDGKTRHPIERVTLTALKTAQDALLILSDNGPGIPERLNDKLFQPFAGSNTSGSGLGLAIARELAQSHGGDVRLISTGQQGTSFEIRLPLKT
jgi:signal transduction histidine kinase